MDTKLKLTTEFEVYKAGYDSDTQMVSQLEPVGCRIESDLLAKKPSAATVVEIAGLTFTADTLKHLLNRLHEHQSIVKMKFPDDLTG